MGKKTFKTIHNESVLKNYEARKAVWRTRAFRAFREKEGDRVKGELEARRREIAGKPQDERSEVDQMWFEFSFERAFDEALKSEFIRSAEGRRVLAALKVGELVERPISYDQELFAGKYLTLNINLTFPKEHIRAQFEHILKKMHPQVERPPIPPRGKGIPKGYGALDKIDDMYEAFDLVDYYQRRGESYTQSLVRATNDFFKKARAIRFHHGEPITDKRYQQVKRWHQKVKDRVGEL